MKILVLGIGNILFYDEGIGVHFCKFLERKWNFCSKTNTIDFVDGGTLANLLIPTMSQYDQILIIDCIDANDAKVGDIYFFDYEVMPKKVNWSGSAHEVEMLQTLQMMEIYGDLPKTYILGVVPKRIEPMICDISDEMRNQINLLEKTALNHIKSLDFEISLKKSITIDDIIKERYDNCF